VRVVPDPEPSASANAWRSCRACIESIPADATHVLVIQDDAEPCRNLAAVLPRLVAARPDRIICLFVGGAPRASATALCHAGDRGETFAEIPNRDWLPCVATIYPAAIARDILEYVDARTWSFGQRGDDHRLGEYMRSRRVQAVATVPCLIQHPDVEPSLIGTAALRGRNPARVACCWIGDHDPLMIDWR
jgi:hypothetical protein